MIQERAHSQSYDEMKADVMAILQQHFRPEFLNRIDETVVFHPLAQSHIRNITRIQLQRLYQRLAERDYTMQLTDDALDHLAAAGFDPVYGARPLKRAIQQQLENPLAQRILAGKLVPGKAIHVDVKGDELLISQ